MSRKTIKLENPNILRDALYNLSPKSGIGIVQPRGVLVGVTATLCALGMNIDDVYEFLYPYMPDEVDENRFPDDWYSRFFPNED